MSSRTTEKANEPRRAERFCLTERRGAIPHPIKIALVSQGYFVLYG
jgi:hypothetical protein